MESLRDQVLESYGDILSAGQARRLLKQHGFTLPEYTADIDCIETLHREYGIADQLQGEDVLVTNHLFDWMGY